MNKKEYTAGIAIIALIVILAIAGKYDHQLNDDRMNQTIEYGKMVKAQMHKDSIESDEIYNSLSTEQLNEIINNIDGYQKVSGNKGKIVDEYIRGKEYYDTF